MDGVPDSEQETALVSGIIELGHNLGLDVVAEGIERPEQLEALKGMGCDRVQGFLLARPQGPGGSSRCWSPSRPAASGPQPVNGWMPPIPRVLDPGTA